MTVKLNHILFLSLVFIATGKLYAAGENSVYGDGGYFAASFILLTTAALLIYFVRKRKEKFADQIAEIEKQNKKLKNALETLQGDNSDLLTKRISSLKEEINDMFINLKALKDSLERTKMDSMRNSILLSNLGSSIRTNLNGIIGFAILLENEFALEEENEMLDFTQDIKRSGESLLYLLNNIIDISRIEANTFKMRNEDCDLKSLTETIIDEYYPKAEEKGVKIVFQDGSVPLFTADNDVLKHIFINLMDNAVKFTDKGFIKVTTGFDKEKKEVVWSIKDTGAGIDKAYLPDLFEPYRQYSLGYSKRNYQGVGLGLPLVKKMLDRIGGSINIESEKAVGTTVMVKLPFKIKEKKTKTTGMEKSTRQKQVEEVKLLKDDLKILIVEPEKFDGMLMKKMLDESAMVFIAPDAESALQQTEHFKRSGEIYDIVFIELKVNETKQGTPLVREIIKRYPEYDKVPFVAISSYPQLGEEEEVKKQGFADYLLKPVVKLNMFKIINNLLANKQFI